MFADNVVGNAFVPPGVDPAYARFLQETAHQAVENAANVVSLRTREPKTSTESVPALKP